MAGSRDDSLLFSLKALEELETKRVEDERMAAERSRAREGRRRAAVEQRAREAEMQRLADEERRRLEAERARREEDARLEAEKLAAIARARAEVDAKARADLARAEAAHAVEIAEARGRAEASRYRFLFGLSLSATVVVGAMAAVLSHRLRETEEQDVRRASALESAHRDRERAEEALAGARREIGDLRARLLSFPTASATSATPEPATGATPVPPGRKPTRGKPASPGDVPAACTADEHDPLGCLVLPKRK